MDEPKFEPKYELAHDSSNAPVLETKKKSKKNRRNLRDARGNLIEKMSEKQKNLSKKKQKRRAIIEERKAKTVTVRFKA